MFGANKNSMVSVGGKYIFERYIKSFWSEPSDINIYEGDSVANCFRAYMSSGSSVPNLTGNGPDKIYTLKDIPKGVNLMINTLKRNEHD